MGKRGKHKSAIWQYYVAKKDGPQRAARCMFCDRSMYADPRRMTEHLLQKCSAASEEVRLKAGEMLLGNINNRVLESFEAVDQQQQQQGQGQHPAAVEALPARPVKRARRDNGAAPFQADGNNVEVLGQERVVKRKDAPTAALGAAPMAQSASMEASFALASVYDSRMGSDGDAARLAADEAHFLDGMMRACIVTNVPWTFVHHEYVREAVAAIRPGFLAQDEAMDPQPVLRRLLAQAVEQRVAFINRAEQLTIMCDSFGSEYPLAITQWIVVNGRKESELVDVTRRSAMTDADQLVVLLKAQATSRSRNELMLHFTCDRPALFQKVEPVITAEMGHEFAFIGSCMTYQTNLLLKDLSRSAPFLPTAIERASKLAAAVNRCTAFSNLVRDELLADPVNQGRAFEKFAMVEPDPTSWESFSVCINQALCLSKYVRQVMAKHHQKQFMKPSEYFKAVAAFATSDKTWEEINAASQVMEPFNYISCLSESATATAGQTLLLWIWWLMVVQKSDALTTTLKRDFEERFLRRIREFIRPHHLVCLVLDPRIRGAGLSKRGMRYTKSLAMDLIKRLLPNCDLNRFVKTWDDYLSQVGDFGANFWTEHDVSRPNRFWSQWIDDESVKEIYALGQAVTSYCAHVNTNSTLWKVTSKKDITADYEGDIAPETTDLVTVKYSLMKPKRLSVIDVKKKHGKVLEFELTSPIDLLVDPTDPTPNESRRARGSSPAASLFDDTLNRFEDVTRTSGKPSEAANFEVSWLNSQVDAPLLQAVSFFLPKRAIV